MDDDVLGSRFQVLHDGMSLDRGGRRRQSRLRLRGTGGQSEDHYGENEFSHHDCLSVVRGNSVVGNPGLSVCFDLFQSAFPA